MKQVTFMKQGMENFCNHIDPIELEFKRGQLIMVTGPNGSGKTSLFQALPFTLYGQCEKGRGEDVLNDKIGKNCHTWTLFDINGTGYQVDRYIKYARLGTTVTLTKVGDSKPYKKGHKEVVPEIERLLLPYKLFMNTLLFSQKIKTFFTDLTDSQQKEIFRKILTLDDYVLYHKQSGVETKEVQENVANVDRDTLVVQNLIVETKDQLEVRKTEKKEFYEKKKEDLKRLAAELKDLETKFNFAENRHKECLKEDLDGMLATISGQIGFISAKLNSADKDLEAEIEKVNSQKLLKETEVTSSAIEAKLEISQKSEEKKSEIGKEYQAKLDKHDDEIKVIDMKVREAQNFITAAEVHVANSKEEHDKIDKNLKSQEPICPNCLQEVTPEAIRNIEAERNKVAREFKEHLKDLENCNQEKNSLSEQLKILKNDRRDILDAWKALVRDIEDDQTLSENGIDARLQEVILKVEELAKTQIKKVEKDEIKSKRKLLNDLEELKEKKDGIDSLITARNEAAEAVSVLRAHMKVLEDNTKVIAEGEYNEDILTSLIEKLKSFDRDLEILASKKLELHDQAIMAEFWRKGFSPSGIQSMLIDDAIPFMNEKIADYMDKLSHGRYSVSFDTLKPSKDGKVFKDKISVEVFDNFTHADARIKLSGGQERLVDIGTILTLCDLQSMIQDVEFNILLFDEIFDALDDNNIGQVANLIKRVSMKKWVGVISHRHIDSVECDEVLEFRG